MRVTCLVVALLALFVGQRHVVAQDKADAVKAAAALQGEVLKKVMAKFDLNGDGTVDDEEKAKVTEGIKKDMEAGNIPEGFKDLLDRNGNGKLEAQEAAAFREMVARMQAAGAGAAQFGAGVPIAAPGFGSGNANPFAGQVPPDVLKKFDKNKNGKLDDDEQKAAMAAFGPKKSRKEQLQEKLDLNGDGKITKEEREQVAAQRKAELEEKKAEAEAKKTKKKDDK